VARPDRDSSPTAGARLDSRSAISTPPLVVAYVIAFLGVVIYLLTAWKGR
jgi:hypothetical protein